MDTAGPHRPLATSGGRAAGGRNLVGRHGAVPGSGSELVGKLRTVGRATVPVAFPCAVRPRCKRAGPPTRDAASGRSDGGRGRVGFTLRDSPASGVGRYWVGSEHCRLL